MNIIEKRVATWDEAKCLFEHLSSHLFRGQVDSSWEICSSLEMTTARYAEKHTSIARVEHWLIHEFIRRYHLYAKHLPRVDDLVEWVAIMQHHGAPTRFVDFTYSHYVASFFAVSSATSDAAVWAIDPYQLKQAVCHQLGATYTLGHSLKDEINQEHRKLLNDALSGRLENTSKVVIPIEPDMVSERISRQQGVFIAPAQVESRFMSNLHHSFLALGNIGHPHACVTKIVLPFEIHRDVLSDLYSMNITAETLFPGLDGFAQSLAHQVIRSR